MMDMATGWMMAGEVLMMSERRNRRATDHLDNLLREAAGTTPDPAMSRHAIRASLAPELARRRGREKRERMRLTLAIATVLLVVMCGQLGSEDFQTVIETRIRNGVPSLVYRQGIGTSEVWTRPEGQPGHISLNDAEELLRQRTANEGVIVGLVGYALGGDTWFIIQKEFKVNGRYILSGDGAEGQGEKTPESIRAYMRAGDRQNPIRLMEISHSRDPDYSLPMTWNGLEWDVNAWRITLPDMPEIIYFTGLRHDGVRSEDGDVF